MDTYKDYSQLELIKELKSLSVMLGIKTLSAMDLEEENKFLKDCLIKLAMVHDEEEKQAIANRILLRKE